MSKSLSIMIPTIVGREQVLSELVCDLIRQCGSIKSTTSLSENGCEITVLDFENVEIIIAKDNRTISTGAKRNLLLRLAKNDYVVSIDDDDYVYPYYVEEILKATQSNPDCVGTRGIYTNDGNQSTEWRLSKDYPNETISENGRHIYLRTTNHISPVKRLLALKAGYPDKSNAEDKEYSLRLNPLLKTEVHIQKVMYHYRYSSQHKSYT
jgi:Glycosyl transferase family 2